ncbi:MAG: GDSL-type esterase/lipase family protein [Blastocatellia bacterium]
MKRQWRSGWQRGGAALLCALTMFVTARAADRAAFLHPQPIENPEALSGFFAALARTQAQRAGAPGATEATETDTLAITRIAQYGDSHTAADLLTGTLRQLWQRDYGDAGAGFVYAGYPWPWYRRAGIHLQTSAGWRAAGLGPLSLPADGRFGLSGVSFTARDTGAFIRITGELDYAEILLLKQPGGGAIDVLVDGQIQQRNVSLAAAADEPFYLTPDIPSSTHNDNLHSVELRTATPGAVRVLGLIAERNRAGVILDAYGVNGARATRLLQWNEALLADNLAWRDPDLVILAYGANEAGDAHLDPAQYQRQFRAALARIRRAVPRAALLALSPPDRAARRGQRWISLATLPALTEAQRLAARESGAAFWNLSAAMGGPGSIDRWTRAGLAQPDRVHLTRAGYNLIAQALYEEMQKAEVGSQKSENHW